MFQLAIGSLLLGAVFGLRFRVIAVLPIMLIGCTTIGAAALITGQSGLTVVLSLATHVLALQAGYLVGSFSRFTVAAARAVRIWPGRSSVKTTR